MTLEQCYQTLEVATGASLTECEESYRRLVRVWHPDRFGVDSSLRRDAEEKLKRINVAMDQVRANVQAQSTKGTPERESTHQQVAYRDSVFFRGGDPRFSAISPVELISGGHPAIVEVTPAGVVVATMRNNVVREAVTYRPEFIRGIKHEPESPDLTLIAVDPEGISRSDFQVVVRFKTWYFASLFVKRFRECVKLEPTKASQPQADVRQKPPPQQPSDSSEVPELLVPLGIIACVLFFAFVNYLSTLGSGESPPLRTPIAQSANQSVEPPPASNPQAKEDSGSKSLTTDAPRTSAPIATKSDVPETTIPVAAVTVTSPMPFGRDLDARELNWLPKDSPEYAAYRFALTIKKGEFGLLPQQISNKPSDTLLALKANRLPTDNQFGLLKVFSESRFVSSVSLPDGMRFQLKSDDLRMDLVIKREDGAFRVVELNLPN